jgi:hypothetical protein
VHAALLVRRAQSFTTDSLTHSVTRWWLAIRFGIPGVEQAGVEARLEAALAEFAVAEEAAAAAATRPQHSQRERMESGAYGRKAALSAVRAATVMGTLGKASQGSDTRGAGGAVNLDG